MPDDESKSQQRTNRRRRYPHGLGFFQLERTVCTDEQGNSKIKVKVITHIPLKPSAVEMSAEENTKEERPNNTSIKPNP